MQILAFQHLRQAPLQPPASLWDRNPSLQQDGSQLTNAVLSPTNRSRTRCSDCVSSCSAVFRSTKRMVGRVAASAIPSASRSSFFWAFTYGRTYSGDISRTSCPCSRNRRPRWCAPQQASIAITHGVITEVRLTTLSRCIGRRRTTLPLASRPTTLQMGLPTILARENGSGAVGLRAADPVRSIITL